MSEVGLPPRARYATLAAIALGMMVSVGSCQDVHIALNAETLTIPDVELSGLEQLSADPKVLKAAQRAAMHAQLYAIETMGFGRVVLLALLSLAASTVCVWGLRVRWPGGARRTLALKISSFGALGAAVLGAMDGGQQLVIVKRGAEAMALALGPTLPTMPDLSYLSFAVTVATAAKVLVVVGGFLFVSAVYRSPSVVEAASKLDAVESD